MSEAGRMAAGRSHGGAAVHLLSPRCSSVSGMGLLVLTNLLAGGRNTQVAPGQSPAASRPTSPRRSSTSSDLQTQLSDDARGTQSRRLLVGLADRAGGDGGGLGCCSAGLAGRVLRPLRTITAATRRISADNLHERLAVPGPADEVKDLADTIDELLERLEALVRRPAPVRRQRLPRAAHPAGHDAGVAGRGRGQTRPGAAQTVALADRLRTELDRVDRAAGRLPRARPRPARRARRPGDVSLGAPGRRGAGRPRRRHRGEGPDRRHGELARQRVDRGAAATLLSRMVDNVIDNAIVHNHDGGWIRVATAADGTTARLVVETGGRVLDQAQVAGLAQPFQRLGADRTGSDDGSGPGPVDRRRRSPTAHGGDARPARPAAKAACGSPSRCRVGCRTRRCAA